VGGGLGVGTVAVGRGPERRRGDPVTAPLLRTHHAAPRAKGESAPWWTVREHPLWLRRPGRGTAMRQRAAPLFLASLCFLAAPDGAVAQPIDRVARIGYLTASSAERLPQALEPLRLGLRDPGYVEGQNSLLEARTADGQLDRVPALASELVRLKVDVIVAGGPQAAIPAKAATTTIPIVFAFSEDPVAI